MTAPYAPARTALAVKIVDLIETAGPMTVADYFTLCLADPEFGYYKTREPFGADGDFVTAPEVTQLFGEALGIFLVHCWQAQRRPRTARLIEIGPGRGALMKDVLRVITRLAPELAETMTVHLVETSDRLTDVQKSTLQGSGYACRWHKSLDTVPEGYTLLVANELFDALPVRQFVKSSDAYRERVVLLDAARRLTFGVGAEGIDTAMLPDDADRQPDGTVFEAAPAREGMMWVIAERLAAHDGAALIVDYGHLVTGYGDTLQALRGQQFDDPLAHPGEADLTSHVDFQALANMARAAGAHIAGLARQGDFLLGLGLLERAGRLGAGKTALEQTAIRTAVERIAGEGAGKMGELFKVLAITGRPASLQPFSASDV